MNVVFVSVGASKFHDLSFVMEKIIFCNNMQPSIALIEESRCSYNYFGGYTKISYLIYYGILVNNLNFTLKIVSTYHYGQLVSITWKGACGSSHQTVYTSKRVD